MSSSSVQAKRLQAARASLEGLSVGDAIGESLSYQHYRCRELADFSDFRPGSLHYTDDTEMALAIYETLKRLGGIDDEVVAWAYASHYRKDPDRGYGKMARRILQEIGAGRDWRELSQEAFGGGSFGNGAAMRVAPLGAFFGDDLAAIPEMARRSAHVTHAHPEGIAGAIAVALAAGAVYAMREKPAEEALSFLWKTVLESTPESRVREGIERARTSGFSTSSEAAQCLGNGADISAQDTVPFCLWSVSQHLGNYREAILSTIEVGGDCDTNAAIVGGIIASYLGVQGIPEDWRRVREVLPIG